MLLADANRNSSPTYSLGYCPSLSLGWETSFGVLLNQIRADEQGIFLDNLKEAEEKAIPMKRYGQAAEFAKAIVFLASGANTYVTGQSLIVDGGSVKAL